MERLNYLAYGSNLHPLRLRRRIPSATLIGTTVITNSRLVFHKHGADDSGKCTILNDTDEHSVVHAVVYTINADESILLDKVEGTGYSRQQMTCNVNGNKYSVFCYVALPQAINPSLRPFYWYRELVLTGARYHRFPENYIARLAEIDAIPDQDTQREQRNQTLLLNINNYNAE